MVIILVLDDVSLVLMQKIALVDHQEHVEPNTYLTHFNIGNAATRILQLTISSSFLL